MGATRLHNHLTLGGDVIGKLIIPRRWVVTEAWGVGARPGRRHLVLDRTEVCSDAALPRDTQVPGNGEKGSTATTTATTTRAFLIRDDMTHCCFCLTICGSQAGQSDGLDGPGSDRLTVNVSRHQSSSSSWLSTTP